MARPTALDLCAQLGRFWAQRTAVVGGLTFADTGITAPCNLHASARAFPSETLNPSASITPGPSVGPTGMSVVTRQTVVIEARAGSDEDAMAMLADLRSLLRPGERPFVDPSTRGYIGMPPPAVIAPGASRDVWRVVGVDLVNEPQTLNVAAGPMATEDGRAAALLTLAFTCVPQTVRYAFSLWQAVAAPTVTAATCAVDETNLTLNVTPDGEGGGDLTAALSAHTVGTLCAAIDALGGASAGWETDSLNGAASALPAKNLIGFPVRTAHGTSNVNHLLASVA